MVKLSPKKKAQKPKTRKPKAIPWRVKYGAHTKAMRPCITPFNEPEHAVSYPVTEELMTPMHGDSIHSIMMLETTIKDVISTI